MLWFLRAAVSRLHGWRLYVLLLGAVFLLAWALLAIFEPNDAPIDDARNYWWWFIVTAFTVGYGDLFPVSTGGRIAALLVMITAIGVVAALVSDVLARATLRKSRRLKGMGQVNSKNHFIVIGYEPARTERLVRELISEPSAQVVICAGLEEASEHPLPDEPQVSFVSGDPTDAEVLARAGAKRARAIIVDGTRGQDDATALVALVAHRVAADAHIVVAARDLDRMVRLLAQFGSDFECAEWHDVRMLSEAANDPGITRFHADLKAAGGSDTHSLLLPDQVRGRTFGDVLIPLKAHANATACALGKGERFTNNPPLGTALEPGMTLYYIADHRLTWNDVAPLLAK
ncbi:MAG: hypothetical protein HOQ05_02475 [Corynebacteriales bacterium]|nr:hypothetical protein [Mycobacteriales bacterium]